MSPRAWSSSPAAQACFSADFKMCQAIRLALTEEIGPAPMICRWLKCFRNARRTSSGVASHCSAARLSWSMTTPASCRAVPSRAKAISRWGKRFALGLGCPTLMRSGVNAVLAVFADEPGQPSLGLFQSRPLVVAFEELFVRLGANRLPAAIRRNVGSVFRGAEPRLQNVVFGPTDETAIVGYAADAVGLGIVTRACEFNVALEVIVDGIVTRAIELHLRADAHRTIQSFAQFLFGSALCHSQVRERLRSLSVNVSAIPVGMVAASVGENSFVFPLDGQVQIPGCSRWHGLEDETESGAGGARTWRHKCVRLCAQGRGDSLPLEGYCQCCLGAGHGQAATGRGSLLPTGGGIAGAICEAAFVSVAIAPGVWSVSLILFLANTWSRSFR